MRSPRWDMDVEAFTWEVGERAAWLLVLEDVGFGSAARLGLYLGSYAQEMAAVQHLEQEDG